MTLGRWFGPGLIDRRGRVIVGPGVGPVALVGLLMVVFGQMLPVAMAGAVLWGARHGAGLSGGDERRGR